MNDPENRAVEILRELGARPAAPFFEEGPARFIRATLDQLGVDHEVDAYGNIIARYELDSDRAEPPVAFVAHMDHPGFEITEASSARVVARALGGVPVASLHKPTPVRVLADDGPPIAGRTAPLGADQRRENTDRLVSIIVEAEVSLTPPLPVVFDLPGFVLDGDTVRMLAADDLAGCASILAALERLIAQEARVNVYGVFTRAEEVGLVGARLLAEAGTLPKETLVVSLESSPVIPGVAQGEGPVIRTGDAAYTFDAEAEQMLIAAREAIREREPDFRCQRQLLSGGTCEATAFALAGYRATGIAFPLGNYHNATTRIADPDGGVDAEYIRLPDYLGGVDLITEAAKSLARRTDTPVYRRLGCVSAEVRERLSASARD